MATVSHEQQLSPLQQKHRSQSDSNLLSPGEQNGNPDSVAVLRSGTLGCDNVNIKNSKYHVNIQSFQYLLVGYTLNLTFDQCYESKRERWA